MSLTGCDTLCVCCLYTYRRRRRTHNPMARGKIALQILPKNVKNRLTTKSPNWFRAANNCMLAFYVDRLKLYSIVITTKAIHISYRVQSQNSLTSPRLQWFVRKFFGMVFAIWPSFYVRKTNDFREIHTLPVRRQTVCVRALAHSHTYLIHDYAKKKHRFNTNSCFSQLLSAVLFNCFRQWSMFVPKQYGKFFQRNNH